MNDIIPELESRKSRRALASKPVPHDVQERLVEAAISAASCFNNQPWRYIFVDDDPALAAVRRNFSGNNYWAEAAPLVVLVVTDPGWDCRVDEDRDYALFDTGMSAGYLILQAVREGLVAHPIAGFKAPELKAELGIDEEHILITCIVIGYPADPQQLTEKHRAAESSPRSRKPIDTVVYRNTWQEERARAAFGH